MGIENIKEMEEKLQRIKVSDIMSRFAITTSSNTTVTNLAHLLMRFKISGVPVVGEHKEIIGIVTATDLFNIMKDVIKKIENYAEGTDKGSLLVSDVMTKNVFSVSEETSLFEVLQLMSDKNIHTLPVVSQKEIVGIIGRRDVINSFYADV